ncbi:N-6 DNA methylase [Clostridium lundense]|uniref:N-6 DNA methylase n=1 Tax=Clostridium lundense TaxID=319475 RepID=UPI000A5699D2|nr:N-6 DNA methylase [Clostridium lundense]
MSEELFQRNLINSPYKIGNWNFYNIGATSIKSLKESGIIENIDYADIENRKPDGLIVSNSKKVIAVIENKKPSEFNTDKKRNKAIKQALEVSKVLNAKIAIVTDTVQTIWLNGINGEEILDEDGNVISTIFDYSSPEVLKLLIKMEECININNSQIISAELRNPTPLAKQIWQDIWAVSGATPENCLYTFVEIFIFKYLSDLNVLKGLHNFDTLIEMYKTNKEDEVLEFYAKTIRIKIKELFPKNDKDNTTIINGTIFVSKDDKAIEGYSGVFKKILFRFKNYGKLEKIDYDFKSKLFESFLKESISKKNWGQFFTPLKVVKPMVKMADIKEGMSVCDPACGVGKFLLEAILPQIKRYYSVDRNGKLTSKITLHGFDKGFDREEQKTIILAKANMLIYFSDLIKEHIESTKDFAKLFNDTFTLKTNSILGTLRDPVENEYDLILTNPPYVTSGSSNLKDEIKKDTILEAYYKTNGLGVEGLFMEWIVKALKPNGKAFVVIPDGILNRQNDTNLRKFILENCYVDALISLPLNTFFTTNKKTYIIALTKKNAISDIQTEPVFSYLVSDIGETLDINRFETGENQLETAVNLFNQFKGAKTFFESKDLRCKIFNIDEFINTVEKGWIIDRWWSEEEKIKLGIIEKMPSMTMSDFSNFIGDIANEITEYQSIFKELDEKKNDNLVDIKTFKLYELFDVVKGYSKYTKSYGNAHKGSFPVYSASNLAPLTYIDTYDFDGNYLTWATNGFAGYMKVINGKFSANGDRGVLIPRFTDIDLGYVKLILEPILRELAKGRKGEDGKDEFTKLYPSMIKDIEIEMPMIIGTDSFCEKTQKQYVKRSSVELEFKDKIRKFKETINNFNFIHSDISKSVTIKIKDLFYIFKGKSIYTHKYFVNNIGEYPVYSSQTKNNGEIAKISTFDFDTECITWTTDGVYAGTVFYRKGKFSMTTHCGALILKEEYKETIDIYYVYAYLSSILRKHADGEQNKRVTVNIIKNIEIIIPINESGLPNIEEQRKYAKQYQSLESVKNELLNKVDEILNVNIIF